MESVAATHPLCLLPLVIWWYENCMRCQDQLVLSDLDGWIRSTARDAVAYATSLLGDPTAAEDVVQDCYCRLLARARVYNLARDGRQLLFASVTNACANRVTRKRATLSLDSCDGGDGIHHAVADPNARPAESVAMDRELEQAIGEAMGRLPERWRTALELKSLGHSLQEIAAATGVTTANAGVLVHRARRAVARLLEPMLGGVP